MKKVGETSHKLGDYGLVDGAFKSSGISRRFEEIRGNSGKLRGDSGILEALWGTLAKFPEIWGTSANLELGVRGGSKKLRELWGT